MVVGSVENTLENQIIASMSSPPVFLTKNHLPLHVMPYGYKGGKIADFWGCYLWPKFDVNRLFDNPSDGYRRQLPLHRGAKERPAPRTFAPACTCISACVLHAGCAARAADSGGLHRYGRGRARGIYLYRGLHAPGRQRGAALYRAG